MNDLIGALGAVMSAYRNDPRGQKARLVIPRWMANYLDAMSAEEREKTLQRIDRIASGFGLDTPTLIEVCE